MISTAMMMIKVVASAKDHPEHQETKVSENVDPAPREIALP